VPTRTTPCNACAGTKRLCAASWPGDRGEAQAPTPPIAPHFSDTFLTRIF
jgi:hypothetical protein